MTTVAKCCFLKNWRKQMKSYGGLVYQRQPAQNGNKWGVTTGNQRNTPNSYRNVATKKKTMSYCIVLSCASWELFNSIFPKPTTNIASVCELKVK